VLTKSLAKNNAHTATCCSESRTSSLLKSPASLL
jgi:hypothetical protein